MNWLAELDAFYGYLVYERHRSALTVDHYASDLTQFTDYLERQHVQSWNDVHARDVRGFLAHLQAQGLAKSSLARKASAIRSFYHYLMQRGVVTSNPMKGFLLPKKERKVPRVVSVQESEQMFAQT